VRFMVPSFASLGQRGRCFLARQHRELPVGSVLLDVLHQVFKLSQIEVRAIFLRDAVSASFGCLFTFFSDLSHRALLMLR